MLNCVLITFIFNLSHLLEEVYLSSDKLSQIPEQFGRLEHLQVLNLAKNHITIVDFKFLHRSLQVLNFVSSKQK